MAIPLALRDPIETVLSFLTIEEIGHACNLSNWTVGEEFRVLVEIARGQIQGCKPRDRMMATDRLRRILLMGARYSGRIADVCRTGTITAADGNDQARLIEVRRTTRLLSDSVAASQQALEAAFSGGHPPDDGVIDVETDELPGEAGDHCGDGRTPASPNAEHHGQEP